MRFVLQLLGGKLDWTALHTRSLSFALARAAAGAPLVQLVTWRSWSGCVRRGLMVAGLGYTRPMSNSEQADGSSLRDDSKSVDESADGSNYRDNEETESEMADGSSLRDDSKGIEENADGPNYAPTEEQRR